MKSKIMFNAAIATEHPAKNFTLFMPIKKLIKRLNIESKK
jgi:hypothetical protein